MISMLYKINHFIATGFYTGKISRAPGTYGSLLALILLIIFPFLKNSNSVIIFFIIGVFSSSYEAYISGKKDKGEVVIDEITGIFLTFINIPLTPFYLIIGFILFRILDIFKPPPINSSQKLPSGLGVMIDDILAGLISLGILNILIFIK